MYVALPKGKVSDTAVEDQRSITDTQPQADEDLKSKTDEKDSQPGEQESRSVLWHFFN